MENSIIAQSPAVPDDGIVQNQPQSTTPDPAAPAQNPAPTPPAQPLTFDRVVSSDGSLAENWRELLPENIRNEKCLDSIRNMNVLAQSYVHAQRAIGANKIAIPGPNATPEEIDSFQRALGRPEHAEDYKFEIPENLPSNIIYSDENMQDFRKFAFEHGWSQQQAADAVAFQRTLLEKQLTRMETESDREYQQTETRLRAEYGDRYDAMIAQCERAVDTYGVREVLKNARLLNNYEVVKMFARIGESISESRLKLPEGNPPSNAQSRYDEIYNNPESPYWKPEHPGHAAAVAEVARLVKMIGGKTAVS